MFMPMFKTAIFLVIIWCCCFYPSHGCLEEERTHLQQIKDSINYPHGSSLDEYWVGKNCCNWVGIQCNSSSSRVISISLSTFYYSSSREERLGLWYPNVSLFAAFKELEALDLSGNRIGGWVAPQAFSEMKSLRKLDLSDNNLYTSIDSLQGLCELKNLRDLNLASNNLGGKALPPCLSNLSMLEDLSLSGNDLGSNSSALTGLCGLRLSALKLLDLGDNHFYDSSLPTCMGNFSLLETLYLDWNNLSGHFGNSISGLKRLRKLDLKWNQMTDDGISAWISNLTSLTTLFLEDNKLKGSDNISGLKRLQVLDLGWNQMTHDGISAWISNLTSLTELYLGGNKLKGLDNMRGLKRLRVLHLEWNHLTDNGISPWISNLTSLTELNLGGNKLKGSDTMRGLCGLSALTTLYLSDNYLSSLPNCMGNFSLLENLNLSGNNLTSLFGNSIPGLKQLVFLDLTSNQLTDDGISPWISNSTSLIALYLENNKLKGSDNIRGLKQLVFLDLTSNQLTDDGISPWISNLTSLAELYLGNNKLKVSDTIRGLCSLRNLQALDIERNSFGSSIDPCFGKMHNLAYLDIRRNQFKGNIPSSIFSNLTMLEDIYISQNQFDGLFSFSTFANLSKLSYIDLSENTQLEVETESTMWVPTFQLESLLLNNCILNKRTGYGIPTFISTQESLNTLELSHTSLKGTIPSWLLYNVTIGSLSFIGNFLEGPFPKPTQRNMSTLQRLDISNNKFSGELPPNIDTLFPNLVLFNMSTNELQGVVPLSLSKLQQLNTLDLSQNKLFGEMPEGLIGNNTSLKFLKLSHNELQGNILSKYWNTTELVVLLLNNNEFTGTITSNMLKSPSLIVLDLRGNKLSGFIPSWLPSLVNLALLLLGENFFDGSIPTQLCQLQNLHILDLSNNKISGSIPSCLNNISPWREETPIQIKESLGPQFAQFIIMGFHWNRSDLIYTSVKSNFNTKGMILTYEGVPFSLMTGIDLSMNQLMGSIPLQMGNLKELRSLNLSRNLLSGPFPESFQSLENIESLDLSYNKLVGMIPPQLVQLHSLSTFSVAFNNLSGVIPFEKQFLTFNESSYTGNPDLCGAPLHQNCSANNPSQTRDSKGEEEEDDSRILDNPMFFYLVVAISYALGFWSFIALICNKNWRKTLFRTVDRCYDWVYVNFQWFQLYLKNHCN